MSPDRFDAYLASGEERFAVRSRSEVIGVLEELQRRGPQISLTLNDGPAFVLTLLLEVYPEYDKVVFDCSQTESANAEVLAATTIFASATLDRIRIDFALTNQHLVMYGDSLALCATIPKKLTRYQRRDHFRVSVPVTKPVICDLTLPGHEQPSTARAVCISCGGLGLHVEGVIADLETGGIIDEMTVTLPEVGTIQVRAEVRHGRTYRNERGKMVTRVGLRYVDPPSKATQMLQRYINRLEMGLRLTDWM